MSATTFDVSGLMNAVWSTISAIGNALAQYAPVIAGALVGVGVVTLLVRYIPRLTRSLFSILPF